MNFKGFLDTIKPFAAVAAPFIPGGPAALALVNTFLPDDEKLPEDATGNDIQNAASTLPPAQKASLMEKQLDVEIAKEEGWTERYKAMCQGDGQSTRPQIAMMMAKVLCFEILAFTVLLVWVGVRDGFAAIENPVLWTVFASLTAVPAGVLGKYFGELRREQNARLDYKPNPLLSLFKK